MTGPVGRIAQWSGDDHDLVSFGHLLRYGLPDVGAVCSGVSVPVGATSVDSDLCKFTRRPRVPFGNKFAQPKRVELPPLWVVYESPKRRPSLPVRVLVVDEENEAVRHSGLRLRSDAPKRKPRQVRPFGPNDGEH